LVKLAARPVTPFGTQKARLRRRALHTQEKADPGTSLPGEEPGRKPRGRLATTKAKIGALFGGRSGLPLVKEGEDVFGGHGASGFEFTAPLAEEELAAGIEDGDGGDTAVERDFVFFGDVEILVHLSDVDMDDEERFVEGGSDFRAVEGFIENMAIETPVAAKDDENTLVGSGGGFDSFRDFLVGIDVGGIEIFLFVERLAETCGCGVLGTGE